MMHDLKIVFLSSRPISWVNTAFPFFAAYVYITQQVDVVVIVGTLFFLIPYNYLMYGINDVYDYESDIKNPRKGGVEGALVPKRLHSFILKSSMLLAAPFIVYLLIVSDAVSRVVLCSSIFMVIAYSMPPFRFKEKPFLDSITSSFHFVSPFVFALSLAGWNHEYTPYVIAFFAWGIASHAFGAVQDILSDRKAGIASIATSIGAKNTVRFSLIFYLLAVLILLYLGGVHIFVAAAGLLYIWMVVPYINLQDSEAQKANNGWRHFLVINQLVGFVITITLVLCYINLI